MLSLLFEASGLRCAIACSQIEEVLPISALEIVPGVAGALAGLLTFRGGMVPAFDAGLLLSGVTSPRKLSTRLVVLRGERPTALICAGAHDVQRLSALPAGARDASPHPLMARVMLAGDRPVHCLAIDRLFLRLDELRGEAARESSRTTA